MNKQTLQTFRKTLVERERTLMRRRRLVLAAERELLEHREPDWEDTAAEHTQVAQLESLGEAELMQLVRIQGSLERMERGHYGECVICHGQIDLERLRAVPEAERCGGCTNGH